MAHAPMETEDSWHKLLLSEPR